MAYILYTVDHTVHSQNESYKKYKLESSTLKIMILHIFERKIVDLYKFY